jgi:hypothetical protein
MSKNLHYRKKPVVIEATQWFKNGDHPLDYSKVLDDGVLHQFPQEEREGDIVRRFRNPDIGEGVLCKQCGTTMRDHGWIDTLEGGHIVCPGDFIITGVKGERYPCKPDIFDMTYESADIGLLK